MRAKVCPSAPRVAFDWHIAARDDHLIGNAKHHYLKKGGSEPFEMGGLFTAPAQADVLERIAQHDRAGFYEGEVAQDMVDSLRAELAEMGHKVITPEEPLGGGQTIGIDHVRGVLIGASDPHKDGCAIGY